MSQCSKEWNIWFLIIGSRIPFQKSTATDCTVRSIVLYNLFKEKELFCKLEIQRGAYRDFRNSETTPSKSNGLSLSCKK